MVTKVMGWFDLKGHVGVTGVKKVVSAKMLLLLHFTKYDIENQAYEQALQALQNLRVERSL